MSASDRLMQASGDRQASVDRLSLTGRLSFMYPNSQTFVSLGSLPSANATEPANTTASASEQPDCPFNVELTFSHLENFDTWVEINISHKLEAENQGKQNYRLRLNRHDLSDDERVARVILNGFQGHAVAFAERHNSTKDILMTMQTAGKASSSRLFEVELPLREFPCTEKIFVPDVGQGPSEMNNLREALRATSKLYFLCFARGLQREVTELNERIMAHAVTDPLAQWFNPDISRRFLQKGQFPERNERPDVLLPSFITFHDWDEYLVMAGFSTIEENDLAISLSDVRTGTVRLLAIPECGDRRYYGFLTDLPQDFRLSPGDAMDIQLNDPTGVLDTETAWFAAVCPPLPFSPLGDTTILINRRYKEEAWDEHDIGVQPVSFGTLKNDEEARRAIQNAPSVEATFRLRSSEKTFKRQVNGLREMTDKPAEHAVSIQLLLARNLEKLDEVDVYNEVQRCEGFSAAFDLAISELNEKQRAAVMMLRAMPGGLGIVEGPGGTGKTLWMSAVLQPLLACRSSTAAPVLVMSTSNDAVDDLARRIDTTTTQAFEALSIKRPVMVTRVHALSTETQLSQKQARDKDTSKRRPPFMTTEPDLSEFAAAKALMDQYKTTTHRPYGISDLRLKHIGLALGTRMLQLSGFSDTAFAEKDNAEFSRFRILYTQLESGTPHTDEQKEQFKQATADLREAVLRRSDVLVATPITMTDHKISDSLEPTIAFLDEAARASEADMWPIFGLYPSLACRILVGDTRQLRPVVNPDNRNLLQARLSFMLRMRLAGMPSVMLTEQHRYSTRLSNVISPVFYNGSLATAPGVDESDDLKKSKEVINSKFKVEAELLWIVPKNSNDVTTASGSKMNTKQVEIGIEIVRHLIKSDIKAKRIGIVTPYLGQWSLYREAMTQLQIAIPDTDFRNVNIDTIDSLQGKEVDYLILDLVATSRLGFLTEGNRLNVGFTRGRFACLVIGNYTSLLSDKAWRRSYMATLFSQFRAAGCVVKYEVTSDTPDLLRGAIPRPDVEFPMDQETENTDQTMEEVAENSDQTMEEVAENLEEFPDATEDLNTEQPVPEQPVPEQPVPEQPVPEQPVPEQPVPEQPVPEQPVAEQPVAEQPVAEQPVAEQPVAEQPVAEQPVPEQPVAEQPVPEQPVPKQPVPEQPVPKQPVPKQPVPKQPVVTTNEGGWDWSAPASGSGSDWDTADTSNSGHSDSAGHSAWD